MASFDIVSEIDIQELDNAVNQTRKEIGSRFDFKGSHNEIIWDRKNLHLLSEDKEYKLGAMKDILQSKVHRRGIDIRVLQFEEPQPASGKMWKQDVTIIQGLDKEQAKKIIKVIKDSKLKVQPAIQGESVRVTSKSIDCLRECMDLIKKSDLEVPVQFTNMR